MCNVVELQSAPIILRPPVPALKSQQPKMTTYKKVATVRVNCRADLDIVDMAGPVEREGADVWCKSGMARRLSTLIMAKYAHNLMNVTQHDHRHFTWTFVGQKVAGIKNVVVPNMFCFLL